ncbi:glycosyltransferase [Novosphingobium cyanobacteriorum]|uniref:Glycosyltransferase n=1 Tax=Novosphingobium cyanobacteriorum TaxID=3024215 RepID=A0ABT6CGS3_9SPHN|nr:glycosyltransferase [Novosphingobium cyanobacteriorum]MDF8333127.1 glycosyltransferase [Novosphingobium cyanobacteriorum]
MMQALVTDRLEDAIEDRGVAVIVTTHNYARFLGDAIDSVLAQSVPPVEVLVVDDGSTDDPAAVLARYPGVRLLAIPQQGIAAARNAALAQVSARFVVFLDADDVLAHTALESGLACMAANPGAGFVYGAHRLVDADLKPLGGPSICRVQPNGWHSLLRGNVVQMHAAVIFDRAKLLAVGGYEATIPRCEDYDLFLRMARRFLVACHPAVVADYRLHGQNMSSDAAEMLAWHLKVLDRNRPDPADVAGLRAWRDGQRHWKKAFTNFVWTERGAPSATRWAQRRKMMRVAPRLTPAAALRQIVLRVLPDPVVDLVRRVRKPKVTPRLGDFDFGDLARLKPVDPNFGYGRGNPVDRYYIERFLDTHRKDVKGRVLEVGTPGYSQIYDSGITRQDVLNVNDDPGTTIRGDFEDEATLPADTFDCVIFTQALQYAYRPEVALRNLYRTLKPGGVLLATLPAITPVDNIEWQWYWAFAPKVANRLFEETFGPGNFTLEVHGNVFAATCFLQGLAVEDVGPRWLDPADPAYPVNITVRALKRTETGLKPTEND